MRLNPENPEGSISEKLGFEETSLDSPICRTNNSHCLGGYPRLYYIINKLKEEKPNALLLEAGDSFQGTFWYTELKWGIVEEFMNFLPIDAHAIGNHDFDDGPEGLAPYLAALKAPALAANMDASNEPILKDKFKSHAIIERDGKKIGVIGLITTDTQLFSITGKAKFLDPYETIEREIAELKKEGVDFIIVLSHCGYDVDKRIAREFGEHVNIVVGGHSHRPESIQRDYPTIVESDKDNKKKVLVVQASAFTKYVGNITVNFDCDGNMIDWDGGMIRLDRSIPEDPVMKAKLKPYIKQVHEGAAVPIGETLVDMPFKNCQTKECALGNLVTDAFNEQAMNTVKTDLSYIAFAQCSYLTSDIPEGTITHGHIVELLPYYDQIETFQMKGKYIIELLERSAKDVLPSEIPNMLQVSGLEIVYNMTKREGKRLYSVKVGQESMDINKFYQVTAPGFLADGGDGYTIFKKQKKNMKVIGYDQDVLKDYIKKHSPIDLNVGNRINIVH